MNKLDMFQSRFGKIYKFGLWDLERISADLGQKFTSTEFIEECQTCGFHLTLESAVHQEMNRQVELTWRMLCKIAHSLMVYARVSEAYIHFELMYITDHIFPVLPMKNMMNKDSNLTTTFKLATCTKPSVSHICVLFFLCIVQKATAHMDKNALNMRHQYQKGFGVPLLELQRIKKGILCMY